MSSLILSHIIISKVPLSTLSLLVCHLNFFILLHIPHTEHRGSTPFRQTSNGSAHSKGWPRTLWSPKLCKNGFFGSSSTDRSFAEHSIYYGCARGSSRRSKWGRQEAQSSRWEKEEEKPQTVLFASCGRRRGGPREVKSKPT